jgi:hypothetical protein
MSLVRFFHRGSGGLAALAFIAAAGCSTDDPVPACENCESWDPVTAGLGRFPEPHPSNAGYLLFSTVDKTPGAPDANRDTDEDIWLLERREDPASSLKWQLTDDALGIGDNFAATWSPSGTQIAFVHTTAGGNLEIWRMSVQLPGAAGDPPVLGAAERMVQDARDVTWATETTLVFSKNDKLFSLDIPAAPGPPTATPVQLTFDPPSFASTEDFVDRHPFFAPDGGAVFNAIGRQAVADVLVRAFEVDDTVFPPDTISTAAWLSYRGPTSTNAAYPVFIGTDTLRTPTLLQSLPVDGGSAFEIGVRRDSNLLNDPTIETYCDTTIISVVDLQPGDVDTLSYYFRVIRGTLVVTSGVPQTDVFWTRQDVRETIADYTSDTRLDNLGEALRFECLMPFAINPDGSINTAVQETLIVTGFRSSLRDTVKVLVDSGKTTTVSLFPPGSISGTVAFSDNPPILPSVLVQVFLAGTAELITTGLSDSTGAFHVPNLPAASFDVTLSATGYLPATVLDVAVMELTDTPLGQVLLTATPGARLGRQVAAAPDGRRALAPQVRTLRRTAPRIGTPGALASPFRAEGDQTTIWRLTFDATSVGPPVVMELFGSIGQLQNPVVTSEFAGGVRYVAYVSDETAEWKLHVQRLVNWQADGAPVLVATPGSSDNYDCDRSVFHPRWATGSAPGQLRLLVAMSDCPSNGFEEIGFDDDPWAVGEIRLWEVRLPSGL